MVEGSAIFQERTLGILTVMSGIYRNELYKGKL